MAHCSEEKSRLIEEIGVSFQDKHHFTPLAARIYAIMILSRGEGFTFEELTFLTEASKSSVSTNLNLLVHLKYVEFFTKSGDRRRYFRSTRNYLRLTLQEHMNKVEEELQLVGKINSYNCEHHPRKYRKNESLGQIYQDFLISQRENIKSTIIKVSDFQKVTSDEPISDNL
jgi:HTH-type transcriptional regulator, glycine betaine synthesis regulator